MTLLSAFFTKVDPQLVGRYYPDYTGPVDVYQLQVHITNTLLRPMIDRHLAPGGLVVDLGCGSGTMVNELTRWGRRAIGVDQDGGAFSRYPALDLRTGSIYEIPVEDGVADLATSKWVFEHLARPEVAVAEVERILRPGGLALIVTPNVLHPSMLLSRILPLTAKQWMLESLNGIQDDLVMKTYYRANTERALDRLFREAGFAKVEFVLTGDPSYWLFSRRLFRVAAQMHSIGRHAPLSRFQMNLAGLYRKAGADGEDPAGSASRLAASAATPSAKRTTESPLSSHG